MKSRLDILKNMTMLYAEAELSTQKENEQRLMRLFKSVKVASSSKEALEMYESHKPNIVMLDTQIPLSGGFGVAREIRKRDVTTPIILNSNHQESSELMEALKIGVSDYLIKPFSFEGLRLSLIEVVSKMQKSGLVFSVMGQNVCYDFLKKSILKENQRIGLTKNESIILEELLFNRGSLVSYGAIEDALSLEYESTKASIKNTVLRLRKKVGKETITNVQDMGYMIL